MTCQIGCKIHIYIYIHWTFLVAQMRKNLPAMWETWVQVLGLEDPWQWEWLPMPVFLPGEFYGQRTLGGAIVLRVPKSWM